MTVTIDTERRIGLFGATFIGVGAIVGGGILALAGTALAATGAGALPAFALNGVIAVVTALSFAELSTAFPQSGGTYTFAKRVLSVGAAFSVGWVAWFASIVAAVLYAMGFAAFAVGGVVAAIEASGGAAPGWLVAPATFTATAVAVTAGCAVVVGRASAGTGNAVNFAKLVLFVVLIGGGAWAWARTGPPVLERLTPVLPRGVEGMVEAMGFTFIAFQGFDLIATVAGEVKEPRRTLPRAMLTALGIALLVYLPLLAVVLVAGGPTDSSIEELVAANPDTVLAEAARFFLGPTGFWLVVGAGALSMLSALLANMYAASRLARRMASDRTLPAGLGFVHARLGTPVAAVAVTAAITVAILVLVGDVASAGAAASLIFLITFALVHVLCVVTRRRKPKHGGFRVPFWPVLPIGGALACGGLALFQSIVVPTAGLVAGVWLVAGVACYIRLFARGARAQDAEHEVVDADLLELRGRSPLVLVPTVSPENARVLALMAACMTPPRVGRVLMLNVLPPLQPKLEEDWSAHLERAAAILRDSLGAAVHAGARTEALATIGFDPWEEIERVARTHRCATVLLGMSELSDSALRGKLEGLASRLTCNVVVFRVPPAWRPESIRRVLVPIRGTGAHNALRARLLASLRHRAAPEMEVEYLLVLPANTTPAERVRRERSYITTMRTEATMSPVVKTVLADDVGAALVAAAEGCDLLILGLSRVDRARRIFSEATRRVIAATECPTLVISDRG